ncbi:hypothetical protein PISMIDRAFT_410305 [Pisolithus microcarpus 441]|uniref:Uncharacterized protein n=1 Tax=Pisolithus microcarpus 441 TaxID=765257 RepID=A0A0C9ZXS5_9AGAM|nr:hypothetical protein BKA83DRAFT_410305 [Pisolithus microcarpus]KIK24463.1 hypothetical protein PISMIDRAFT_410305 [Pisolithus microcarpus 441]
MREPTEGEWRHAGTYRAFRMNDLTTQELPKIGQARGPGERIASKHVREGQQCAVGLLRVSRVGLQCIGFNDEVYRTFSEQPRFVRWPRSSGLTIPLACLVGQLYIRHVPRIVRVVIHDHLPPLPLPSRLLPPST